MSIALSFDGVTKTFAKTGGRALISHRIERMLGIKEKDEDLFYALRDLTFSVEEGATLGIVGSNGAGKTTLLSLAAGISYPDSGRISAHGHVAALLELGAGFHPDLTGTENVRLNAALLGMSKAELNRKMGEIAEFADIGDFLREPLRTYSSGMVTRLAFSVAISVNPDILILDEILAVGDHEFQERCFRKVHEFRDAGKTIVAVSHSSQMLAKLCERALWLHHGRLVMEGNLDDVTKAYEGGAPPETTG
jgi:ABC-type polysaccharide/polyol phosphate transport system ATPase subunit